jgi:hypothetical protein
MSPSQRRGRFGFFGPFPQYSRTTRHGTRVSVGGCCLPLPIGCLTTVLTAAAVVGSALGRSRKR